MQRLEVVFRGRVQGVGFRFTVRDISKQFQVTGFVRNEEDGSVRLVAEGLREELQRFLHPFRIAWPTSSARRRIIGPKQPITGRISPSNIRRIATMLCGSKRTATPIVAKTAGNSSRGVPSHSRSLSWSHRIRMRRGAK